MQKRRSGERASTKQRSAARSKANRGASADRGGKGEVSSARGALGKPSCAAEMIDTRGSCGRGNGDSCSRGNLVAPQEASPQVGDVTP